MVKVLDKKYRVMNALIATVKNDWTARGEINDLCRSYKPLIVKVSERVFYDYRGANERNEIIQTSSSIFLQLVWEYNLDSPVNFNTYLQGKLYFRVWTYYRKDVDVRMGNYFIGSASLEKKNQCMFKDGETVSLCLKNCEQSKWNRVVESLPEIYLDVMAGTIFLGLKQDELAEILGLSQAHVSRVKRDAISRIRKVYREE